MGFAFCRFRADEGCSETGSRQYEVDLPDQNVHISVPEMWKHYALNHLIQPTERERRIIMAANEELASGSLVQTRGPSLERMLVFYVERTGENQYTHSIGTAPDMEFVNKMDSLLSGFDPYQTKGLSFKPGFR